jgi:hypothetical protein
MFFRLVSATMLLLATSCVVARSEMVERTARGESGKDIQIGVYVNIRSDCTSGPLPTIRLTQPPEHGKVTVKKAKLNATNYKQCLALDVPAYVAFYRSVNDFLGTDTIIFEVNYPGKEKQIQHITINVQNRSARRSLDR